MLQAGITLLLNPCTIGVSLDSFINAWRGAQVATTTPLCRRKAIPALHISASYMPASCFAWGWQAAFAAAAAAAAQKSMVASQNPMMSSSTLAGLSKVQWQHCCLQLGMSKLTLNSHIQLQRAGFWMWRLTVSLLKPSCRQQCCRWILQFAAYYSNKHTPCQRESHKLIG